MARTEYGHDPRRRLRARQAPVARLRRIRRRIARRRFGALARRFRAGGLATQGAGPAAVRRAGAADRPRERSMVAGPSRTARLDARPTSSGLCTEYPARRHRPARAPALDRAGFAGVFPASSPGPVAALV